MSGGRKHPYRFAQPSAPRNSPSRAFRATWAVFLLAWLVFWVVFGALIWEVFSGVTTK